jgi:predicted  nucleic acid-binding Zn-ribbon protein
VHEISSPFAQENAKQRREIGALETAFEKAVEEGNYHEYELGNSYVFIEGQKEKITKLTATQEMQEKTIEELKERINEMEREKTRTFLMHGFALRLAQGVPVNGQQNTGD